MINLIQSCNTTDCFGSNNTANGLGYSVSEKFKDTIKLSRKNTGCGCGNSGGGGGGGGNGGGGGGGGACCCCCCTTNNPK